MQMHLCPLLPASLGLEEDTSFTKESTTFHESGRDKAPWESAVRRDGPSGDRLRQDLDLLSFSPY